MARVKKPGVPNQRSGIAAISMLPVNGQGYWIWWHRAGAARPFWQLALRGHDRWFPVGRTQAVPSSEVTHWQGPVAKPAFQPEIVPSPLSPEKQEIERLRRVADAEDARMVA